MKNGAMWYVSAVYTRA